MSVFVSICLSQDSDNHDKVIILILSKFLLIPKCLYCSKTKKWSYFWLSSFRTSDLKILKLEKTKTNWSVSFEELSNGYKEWAEI